MANGVTFHLFHCSKMNIQNERNRSSLYLQNNFSFPDLNLHHQMHNIYICWKLRASFENSISLLHVQYENIVIGHDHFEFHIRNIVQNAFYEMKRVRERIGSSTFNGQRRLLQRTKKLSRRFGMNYGMQRDWPAARNNHIRDNCESFPERRMAVSLAKISRKTILIPRYSCPFSRGISIRGKGGVV